MGKNKQITYTVKKIAVNQRIDIFVMVDFLTYNIIKHTIIKLYVRNADKQSIEKD